MMIESWLHMMKVLPLLTEEELKEAVNIEANGFKRKAILERLHQRYSKLRMTRERVTLLTGGTLE